MIKYTRIERAIIVNKIREDFDNLIKENRLPKLNKRVTNGSLPIYVKFIYDNVDNYSLSCVADALKRNHSTIRHHYDKYKTYIDTIMKSYV